MTAKVDEAKLALIYNAHTGHLKRIAEETVRDGVCKVEKSVAHMLSQIIGYEKGFDEDRGECATLVTTIAGIGSFPASQPQFIDRADNVSNVCADIGALSSVSDTAAASAACKPGKRKQSGESSKSTKQGRT